VGSLCGSGGFTSVQELSSFQTKPIDEITTKNAELLRKTTARGAEYCGLNDACLLFTVNLAGITSILSLDIAIQTLCTQSKW
jgi:hypothetical protein